MQAYKTAACAIFLAFVLLCGCVTEDGGDSFSQSVKDICLEQAQFPCIGDCMDGFGEDCYFDSAEYRNLSAGLHSLPEETKAACLGIHSYAVCGSCHNTFELRKNGVLEEVSCEEFYQAVESRNLSCGGCIDTVSAGCC